jgi:hypothetical protein
MLAIAILSLIGLVLGIVSEWFIRREQPNAYPMMTTITTIAWWDTCFPLAVTLLVIGCIWFMIVLIYFYILD